MKIGFDIHGVIDKNPDKYRKLIHHLIEDGVEIHILTGLAEEKAFNILEELKIPYDNLMCIGEWRSKHYLVQWDEKGNPHMTANIWNTAKGDYCKEHGIDIMIDDSEVYGNYIPKGTLYLRQWK